MKLCYQTKVGYISPAGAAQLKWNDYSPKHLFRSKWINKWNFFVARFFSSARDPNVQNKQWGRRRRSYGESVNERILPNKVKVALPTGYMSSWAVKWSCKLHLFWWQGWPAGRLSLEECLESHSCADIKSSLINNSSNAAASSPVGLSAFLFRLCSCQHPQQTKLFRLPLLFESSRPSNRLLLHHTLIFLGSFLSPGE